MVVVLVLVPVNSCVISKPERACLLENINLTLVTDVREMLHLDS